MAVSFPRCVVKYGALELLATLGPLLIRVVSLLARRKERRWQEDQVGQDQECDAGLAHQEVVPEHLRRRVWR